MVVLVDKLSTTTAVFFRSEEDLKKTNRSEEDLKKTTVVVESLSTNTTNVLFQRIPVYFKIQPTV